MTSERETPAESEDGVTTTAESQSAAGAGADSATSADATSGATTSKAATRAAGKPENPAETLAEEQRIRQELGIGSRIEADAKVIDELLQGAVVGYENIFAGTALDEAQSAAERGSALSLSAEAGPLNENLHLLRDVHMRVKVELGRGHMYLKDILRLGQGSVVELDRLAGDPLDIYVNEKVIARGEVLVLNENFCIRITEIFDPADVLRES